MENFLSICLQVHRLVVVDPVADLMQNLPRRSAREICEGESMDPTLGIGFWLQDCGIHEYQHRFIHGSVHRLCILFLVFLATL